MRLMVSRVWKNITGIMADFLAHNIDLHTLLKKESDVETRPHLGSKDGWVILF